MHLGVLAPTKRPRDIDAKVKVSRLANAKVGSHRSATRARG